MQNAHESLDNAVQLVDGDFVGVLSVYHQLHCTVSFIFTKSSCTVVTYVCSLTIDATNSKSQQNSLRRFIHAKRFYDNTSHPDISISHLGKLFDVLFSTYIWLFFLQ